MKKNVALVLSGGGARGLAHIGVIEALEKEGFRITSIAGTSIGALIGGVFISGKIHEYREWMMGLGKMDILRLIDFAVSKKGFIKGEKVFRELSRFISDTDISELSVPFAAVAVDIINHEEIVFTTGNLTKAIRASVSIPTVFQPVVYKKKLLVDGGVLNPLPLDRVKRTEGDILVAVNLNADIPYNSLENESRIPNENSSFSKAREIINEKWNKFFQPKKEPVPKTGFFDLMTLSIYAMQVKLTEVAIMQNQPDILVNISKRSADIYDFHKAQELIGYGKKEFYEAFEKYRG